jgi:hypothetical protein
MRLALAEWRNKVSGRVVLTLCQTQHEEVIKAAKNGQQVRRTHFLSIAEQGSCKGSKLMPASERHSPSVESRAEESLGQQDKVSKQGALTICQAKSEEVISRTSLGALTNCPVQSEGVIRTAK